LLAGVLSEARADDAELASTLDQYVQAACMKRAHCGAAHTWVAQFRGGRGEWLGALNHHERACREDPSEACWLGLAQAAEQAGAFARAAEALEKAQRLRGGDTALMGRIEQNRQRARQTQH
jgi:hypothetical protein